MSLSGLILIFIGAGLGGVLRNGVNVMAMRLFGMGFPIGTMFINIVGSFCIGCVAGWLVTRMEHAWVMHARFFIITGLLGGFTTFSSFSLDALALAERGELWFAALYVGGSVLLSLIAVFGGMTLARVLA